MPKRAIRRRLRQRLRQRLRRLRGRHRTLEEENARLRRDLAAAAGYARELQDRLLNEISECSRLRAELDAEREGQ